MSPEPDIPSDPEIDIDKLSGLGPNNGPASAPFVGDNMYDEEESIGWFLGCMQSGAEVA